MQIFFFPPLDYHYVTREVMQASIDNGEFIENAEFSGNMYGTSKAAVQDVQAKNLIDLHPGHRHAGREEHQTHRPQPHLHLHPATVAGRAGNDDNSGVFTLHVFIEALIDFALWL